MSHEACDQYAEADQDASNVLPSTPVWFSAVSALPECGCVQRRSIAAEVEGPERFTYTPLHFAQLTGVWFSSRQCSFHPNRNKLEPKWRRPLPRASKP